MHVDGNIPGMELLEQDEGNSDEEIDGESCDELEYDNTENGGIDLLEEDGSGESGGDSECESGSSDGIAEDDDELSNESDNDCSDDGEDNGENSDENEESGGKLDSKKRKLSHFKGDHSGENSDDNDETSGKLERKKRKLSDFKGDLSAGDQSLRALKKLAVATQNDSSDANDGILSNEDFQRIKELKVCIFILLNQVHYQYFLYTK